METTTQITQTKNGRLANAVNSKKYLLTHVANKLFYRRIIKPAFASTSILVDTSNRKVFLQTGNLQPVQVEYVMDVVEYFHNRILFIQQQEGRLDGINIMDKPNIGTGYEEVGWEQESNHNNVLFETLLELTEDGWIEE